MKFTVKKENFVKSLQKNINIIGSRSTLPVLGNVLIEASANTICLTSTDLEIRIQVRLDAVVEEVGNTTLPGKKLYSMVSKFEAETISFSCDEKNHTKIKCGIDEFKVLGLPAADFPMPTEFTAKKQIKFKEIDFSRMIDQISYAVSLDDSRKVLHGILCSVRDNTVTAVATDGKRLALVERVPESFEGDEGDTIIPLKTANEVKRIFDGNSDLMVSFGEKQALFTSGKVTLNSKLIEGNYPNYRQVIPASFSKTIELPKSPLLSKLELVSLALEDNSSYIIVGFEENKLNIEASSTGIGEGNSSLEIKYSGEQMDISFNPAFLEEPLRHCVSDKINMKINDGVSPVAIEGGDGFLYVIMPMRNR